MDFFEVVARRGSYRDSFVRQAIPREDLIKIVDAGVRAPSGCNGQTTSFVVVDDPETIRRIAELLGKPFCATAPAMIVCVSETRAVYRDMEFHKEDCAAATQNILLAITALGYASVWLDGVLRLDGIGEKIGELLNVPKNKTVEIVLPVGVPEKPVRQNDRLPWEERAFFNRWGNQD